MSAPDYTQRLFTRSSETTCEAIRENIELISRMEEKYLKNRKPAERVADVIAAFSGSMIFVILHLVVYSAWILINLRIFPVLPVFDPYPFMLLSMIVSLEAIFLSTFVLMKQNRMSKRADARAHLDLQINLRAEKEMTMVLQMLRLIGTRVGVGDTRLDRELAQLSADTPVEILANEIEEKLSKES
ncbi:MAG TPA: DUF1003 domain-containing protein [Bryobacteraceae bacterium]|nr:DUF1003 domain-containing protein [Bryobacteraceae bacterium]